MEDRAVLRRGVQIGSPDELTGRLAAASYFAEPGLALAIYLALALGKPLLLEGEAGVGKTEVAKVLARLFDLPLIRLQCYEGLDVSTAVYEWDYSRQLLHIRLLQAAGPVEFQTVRHDIFSREFLLKRPLLAAVDPADPAVPAVLLIDELDRADEEFEAFLLELLSDFQVTVPELGTFRAPLKPVVVITSNRTREIHDALRRRCLYQWIDYPSFAQEQRIVSAKVPAAAAALRQQVVAFVQALRQEELYKRPGIAETLDWASALVALDQTILTPDLVNATLGVLLKYQDDIAQVRGPGVARTLARLAAEPGAVPG